MNQAAAHRGEQAGDNGTGSLQNYTGHYCNVPSRVDPGIVACSFILSGLRIFDIRDPFNPKEIAYFNGPITDSAYAMSSPSFVPERGEIWYSDGNSGFYAVRVTNGVWPFTAATATAANAATATSGAAPARGSTAPVAPASRTLPATGSLVEPLLGAAALSAGLGLRRRLSPRRRARP